MKEIYKTNVSFPFFSEFQGLNLNMTGYRLNQDEKKRYCVLVKPDILDAFCIGSRHQFTKKYDN